jgi:hypothetical protein
MKWKVTMSEMAVMLLLTTAAPAQTFTVLHTFGAGRRRNFFSVKCLSI